MSRELLTYGVVVVIAIFLALLAAMSIKQVPSGCELVVRRWGQVLPSSFRPGLRWLWWIMDEGILVDMREQSAAIRTVAKAADGQEAALAYQVAWQVIDPVVSIANVVNVWSALQGAARSALQSIVGEMQSPDVEPGRDRIGRELVQRLGDVVGRWGCCVNRVETLQASV